jgi:hypothetical protein
MHLLKESGSSSMPTVRTLLKTAPSTVYPLVWVSPHCIGVPLCTQARREYLDWDFMVRVLQSPPR